MEAGGGSDGATACGRKQDIVDASDGIWKQGAGAMVLQPVAASRRRLGQCVRADAGDLAAPAASMPRPCPVVLTGISVEAVVTEGESTSGVDRRGCLHLGQVPLLLGHPQRFVVQLHL